MNDIVVSIICTTYNHEPYIRRVLDSFVNQRTNFKYEILIHDDASTDGTREILEEYRNKYGDLFKLVLQKENKYSKGVDILGTYIFPLIKGKYISYCEGDDYWPDLDMLQKQYDFLESHSDYIACAGVTRYFNDDDIEVYKPMPYEIYTNKDAKEEEYLNIPGANIATNTIMHRSSMIDDNYLKAKKESSRVGDILLMIKLFESGKIYLFNDVFQIHRIQSRSNASNYNSVFNWKEKYEDVVRVIRAIYNNYNKKHDLHKWYESYAYNFFIDAVKSNDTKSYMNIQSNLPDEYKRSLLGNYVVYGLRYLKSKIK